MDLDEAGEDTIRGTARIVRDQKSEHRVKSVHRLDYNAKRAAEPVILEARGPTERWTCDIRSLYAMGMLRMGAGPDLAEEEKMRLFLAGFLMTGLFLIGFSVYERRAARARGEVIAPLITSDDGSGIPHSNSLPTSRTR
jgi:hypothetical protein